jgi:hypothetical protein
MGEKYFCDRCKKEFKKNFWYHISGQNILLRYTVDFCRDCNKDFKQFMNMEKIEDEHLVPKSYK